MRHYLYNVKQYCWVVSVESILKENDRSIWKKQNTESVEKIHIQKKKQFKFLDPKITITNRKIFWLDAICIFLSIRLSNQSGSNYAKKCFRPEYKVNFSKPHFTATALTQNGISQYYFYHIFTTLNYEIFYIFLSSRPFIFCFVVVFFVFKRPSFQRMLCAMNHDEFRMLGLRFHVIAK